MTRIPQVTIAAPESECRMRSFVLFISGLPVLQLNPVTGAAARSLPNAGTGAKEAECWR
jgi:hypothetical protein